MLNEIESRFPLVSGFAHDLGNLLQTATSAISIIDRGTSERSSRVDMAIAGARASIKRASDLARRARKDVGIGIESALETDVADCLAEVVTILASGLEPEIQLVVEVDPCVTVVNCDYAALQNALLNLTFNARDAVGASGLIIIRASAAGSGSAVEISVADDGAGMSARTMERAFEPNFTTKRDGLGGIGLAMVERFVRASSGKIWIDSGLGTGTVVRLRLPVPPADIQSKKEL